MQEGLQGGLYEGDVVVEYSRDHRELQRGGRRSLEVRRSLR